VFKKARYEEYIAIAYTGEESPTEDLWEAIKLLKISRIDHGYHMFENENFVKYVAGNKVPLTMCPLASVGIEHFKDIKVVPVKESLKRNQNIHQFCRLCVLWRLYK